MNYNVLLSVDESRVNSGTPIHSGNPVSGGNGDLYLTDGLVVTSFGFCLDSKNGRMLFDSAIGGFSKSGNCEYVASNAKFDANLIKDASGTIVGVVFTELAR